MTGYSNAYDNSWAKIGDVKFYDNYARARIKVLEDTLEALLDHLHLEVNDGLRLEEKKNDNKK